MGLPDRNFRNLEIIWGTIKMALEFFEIWKKYVPTSLSEAVMLSYRIPSVLVRGL